MSSPKSSGYKNLSLNPVIENTSSKQEQELALGELQYAILAKVVEEGIQGGFTIRSLYDLSKPRNLHQALQHLAKRGIVEKIGRGLYRLAIDPLKLLKAVVRKKSETLKKKPVAKNPVIENDGTRVSCRGCGGCGGVLLDNVRGFVGGCFVGGDRGFRRCLGDLVFFDGVSYFEVGFPSGFVGREFLFDGCVVVYWSRFRVGGCWRPVFRCVVEYRPPRGFVRDRGVVGVLREGRVALLKAFAHLFSVVVREFGEGDVVKLLRRLARGKWGEFCRALAWDVCRVVKPQRTLA